MGRHRALSVVSILAGIAVLATLGTDLSGSGQYYGLASVGLESFGMTEVAVVGAGLTALCTMLAGAFSLDSKHPWINLGSTFASLAILLGPFYASLGEVIWTGVAVFGILVAGNGAMFVTLVEGKRLVRQAKRSRGQGAGS